MATEKKKDKSGNYREWTSKTYYLIYYEGRKKKYKDTHETDRSKAEEEKERLIKEIEGGTVYSVIKNNKWLSEKESPLYISYRNKTTNYHYQYAQSQKNVRYLRIILEQLKDGIGDKLFTSLSPEDVDDFLSRLKNYTEYKDAKNNIRKITNAFRNCTIDAFSTIYNYYLRTGEIKVKSNPFHKKMRFPKKTDHRQRFVYTPEVINLIFEKELLDKIQPITTYETAHGIKTLTKEKWDEIVNSVYLDYWHFVALSGLRGSEASSIRINQFEKGSSFYILNVNSAFKAGLRKNDLALNDGSVDIIGSTKSGKPRRIVLCDEANRIVRKYAEGKADTDLLFQNENKKTEYSRFLLSQNRARVFRIFINELNAQFGFTDDELSLTIHGFRGALQSNLLEKTNLRESLIAYSLQKTQQKHYTHFSDSDLYSVANEINKLYFGKEMIWQPTDDKKESLKYQDKRLAILKGGQLSGIGLARSQIQRALITLKDEIISGKYFGSGYQEEGATNFDYQTSDLNKTITIINEILERSKNEQIDIHLKKLIEDDGFNFEIDDKDSIKILIIALYEDYISRFSNKDFLEYY